MIPEEKNVKQNKRYEGLISRLLVIGFILWIVAGLMLVISVFTSVIPPPSVANTASFVSLGAAIVSGFLVYNYVYKKQK